MQLAKPIDPGALIAAVATLAGRTSLKRLFRSSPEAYTEI